MKIDNALVPGRDDRAQTTVSWKTDELSTSVVYYEEGSGQMNGKKYLANKVTDSGSLTTGHTIILSSLKPGQVYRIQIESTDQSGNTNLSSARTIVIPQQSESITDIIFKNFEDSFKFLRGSGK